jgi:hypothetical protein
MKAFYCRPWIHWLSSNVGDFAACFTQKEINGFQDAPYITQPDQNLLSAVNHNPNELERMISTGVSNWFSRRRANDFMDSNNELLKSPANIPRWVSHLFLTTTTNLGAALTDPGTGRTKVPQDHFFDRELLSIYSTLLV